ncbi:hypothetical protein [Kribbella sp. C-35]|uniref:hypothetical protein n=1 Tax=Kribbella sp. C-35 TaxID=2789276 RepID=UPI00397C9F95
MTETELKRRLTADVDDIEASPEFLARARGGGARRLRRRRLTAVGAGSLTVAAITAAVFALPAVRDRADQAPVATPTPAWVDPIAAQPHDHYAALMKPDTGGDLAGNRAYLDQVLATWDDAQRTEHFVDPVAGDLWAVLRGEPRIYWAGNTPAGRIAIVVQHYQGPRPKPGSWPTKRGPSPAVTSNGISTTVGIVRDDARGRPRFQEFVVAYDDFMVPYFKIREAGQPDLIVVVGMGKRLGWGLARDKLTPLMFKDGVAAVQVPAAFAKHGYIGPLPAR